MNNGRTGFLPKSKDKHVLGENSYPSMFVSERPWPVQCVSHISSLCKNSTYPSVDLWVTSLNQLFPNWWGQWRTEEAHRHKISRNGRGMWKSWLEGQLCAHWGGRERRATKNITFFFSLKKNFGGCGSRGVIHAALRTTWTHQLCCPGWRCPKIKDPTHPMPRV